MAGRGARVGLLDADIHGPSLAHMTGAASGSLPSTLGETVAPIDGHDLQLASVEFRAEGRQPLARADAARAVVGDLWEALAWADRDYVVVDLPSGVGEAQLTVLEQLPVAGAVVVTTPQEVAVANARETIARCRDCAVPVLGVVENMRTFVCPDCDGVHDEFDTPDSELFAAESDAPLLKQLPLEPSVRERGGWPVVLDDSGLVAGKLSQLARAAMDRLGETRRRAHADRTE
jgi:ATP-binding protein involved in chromosome partitioning